MASVLTAKVQSVIFSHRKSSSKSNAKSERRRSSAQNRVIPPEPVQEKPHGDFTYHQVEPALQAHNLARANKGARKLEWDDRLMKDAESYAQKLAQLGSLDRSGVKGQGENLFMSTEDADLEDAVKSWLEEEKRYAGQIVGGGNFQDGAQFAQCIAPSTKRIGMGKAKSEDGTTYIVARYSPPADVGGG